MDRNPLVNPIPKSPPKPGAPLRVIVCGSRDWQDAVTMTAALLVLPVGSTLVHGDARGADRLAASIGRRLGLVPEPHAADWVGKGRAAGPIRNRLMARLGADLVLAFKNDPDLSLRTGGTENMVRMAEEAGIEYRWIASPLTFPILAPCPSPSAGGREDRCGRFSWPVRCVDDRCSEVPPAPAKAVEQPLDGTAYDRSHDS